MSNRTYQQLQPEERVTLAGLRLQGQSLRKIGQALGRSAGTLSRELTRNPGADGYAASAAQALTLQRRIGARPWGKLHPQQPLWIPLKTCLGWRWSPQQISATLRRMFPADPSMHVSHETIYTAIYAQPAGELRRELIKCLRQAKNLRRPRSAGEDRRGQIPDMVSIHVRPPEVNERTLPGHWEGDLIKGQMNRSAVGVLVERTTGLLLLAKMPDASAASALAAFSDKLSSIVRPLRQTMTYDQGREMTRHAELTANTGVMVYFCDPHSPWQRAACENTNGLIRQYLPKGTDLSLHSQEQLDFIADEINNRPRNRLGWDSPIQRFRAFMQNLHDAHSSTVH
jgi:transposase, IS30 family